MCVLVRTEYAKDIIILMDGLAKIAALLLIPPVGIWITMLALYARRVYVATILDDW